MLTLAWDVDDVLNDFMRCWFEKWWCVKNASCTLSYHNLVTNPPYEILGITLEEYQNSIDEFRLSRFFQQIPPNQEIYKWFCEYGQFFRHIAVTAVPRIAASASASWTFKYFGDWLRSFHFVPSQRPGEKLPQYDSTKGEYLSWLSKVDVFIEDNESNVLELEKLGMRTIVVAQPWNSSKITIEELLSMLTGMHNDNGLVE